MNPVDEALPPPPDPALQLHNALHSWRLQRAEALAGRLPRHSLTWLHAAVEGLELALAAQDLALARLLAGEAVAAALASLYGGPLAAEAAYTPVDGTPLHMPCRPCPAHRWRDALLLACITAHPARLAALGQALPAQAESGGDAWALIAGRAWLGLLAGRSDVSGRLDVLRMTAASDAEQAWVQAQEALLMQALPPAAALAALPIVQTLAVQALLRGRGQADAAAPLHVLDALQGAPVPAVRLQAGRRVALHAREPGWWFDLYGPPGVRQHRLRDEGGHLVAQHEQIDTEAGISLAASFEMADAATAVAGPPALDAGELLTLADRRAHAADAVPPADPAERRRQAARLDDAVQLIDAALARLPAGRAATAADFPSTAGRSLFAADPGRFDRERLAAVRAAYAGICAQAEGGADCEAGRADEVDARQAALAAIETLRLQLEPVLWAIARDRSGAMAAALHPRDEDYARVFTPDAAAVARSAYTSAFRQAGIPRPADPGQTQLVCHLAPAGMLASDNELSRHFPGGYRAVAAQLNPHRVWVRWKFCRPGEPAGMAYDGLVWVDDHWAWFPKPYRVLGEAGPGGSP